MGDGDRRRPPRVSGEYLRSHPPRSWYPRELSLRGDGSPKSLRSSSRLRFFENLGGEVPRRRVSAYRGGDIVLALAFDFDTVLSGFAAAPSACSVTPKVVAPSPSQRRSLKPERARGSAMLRAAPAFGGSSGVVSGRGASDTASAAMSESNDVAPSASLVLGVATSEELNGPRSWRSSTVRQSRARRCRLDTMTLSLIVSLSDFATVFWTVSALNAHIRCAVVASGRRRHVRTS